MYDGMELLEESERVCSPGGAAAGDEHVESMASASVEERLEALLREHGAWLRRTVEQTCPRNLAIQPEEVEQEVRLRLWRALGRESELRHPASYLRRVVTTATIDAIRRVRARREDPLVTRAEEPSNPVAVDPVSADPSPEGTVAGAQTGALIVECLEELSENRGLAVKLYLQGFNYQEVADLLGWSEAKARNLVSRGMRDLRELLQAHGVRRDN